MHEDEKQVDRTAADHYNRGVAFARLSQPLQALPQYEQAYRCRPNELSYARAYGMLLIDQKQYREAGPVLESAVRTARELAKNNQADYQLDLAESLNNLGAFFHKTHGLMESQAAYGESVQIYRELAKNNPAVNQPFLARTLENLGLLYRSMRRLKESQAVYEEALQIRRELAESTAEEYRPDLAKTLNDLGSTYRDMQRLKESQGVYEEALQIYSELAKNDFNYYILRSRVTETLASLKEEAGRKEQPFVRY